MELGVSRNVTQGLESTCIVGKSKQKQNKTNKITTSTLDIGASMRFGAPFEIKKNTNVYDKGDVSLAKHFTSYNSKTTYPQTLNFKQ